MSSKGENSSVIADNWLRQHGSWNTKKTVAKTTLFLTPQSVLCDLRCNPTCGISNDIDTSVIRDTIFSADGRGLTCLTCKLYFEDRSKQQEHFKSEHHRVNLRRTMKGLPIFTQLEFNESVENGLSEDVSDSSDDDDDDSDSEEADVVVDHEEVTVASTDNCGGIFTSTDGVVTKKYFKGNGPMFVFQRANCLQEWEFSISIAAFHSLSGMHSRFWNTQHNPWELLSDQVQRIKSNIMSCVFLLRSGRFAAVIFEGDKIVIHKVLRRYTVRAKAGGGQSSHDNKGGKAKSAGAMLRRYGEQALKEDIHEILRLWSGHLQLCGVIYISAPKTMRSVFFDGETGVTLLKDDPRITYVPFVVDRPTLEEAKFVHSRCTSVLFTRRDRSSSNGREVTFSGSVDNNSKKSSNEDGSVECLDEEEDEQEQWQLLRSSGEATKKSRRRKAKETTASELLTALTLEECAPSRELVTSCEFGDDKATVKLLRAMYAKYGQGEVLESTNEEEDEDDDDETNVRKDTDTKESEKNTAEQNTVTANSTMYTIHTIINSPVNLTDLNTPLHIASSKSMTRTVALLLDMGADPTRVDVRGRPPYFVCTDKETRDVYRRYRGVVGEERYNWSTAGVATALTSDMERDKKNKEKEKKKRAAQRKKEQKAQAEVAAKEAQEALQRQKQHETELALQRQMEAGKCGACGTSLYGIKSLDVYDRRCCSAKCVIALRRTLAAEAAMKRFGK